MTRVALLADWQWHETSHVWYLRCSLELGVPPTEHVPAVTEWYVLADSSYPLGGIAFHPARERGLSVTFQHQRRNTPGHSGRPWSQGNICLDTSVRSLGIATFGSEPKDAGGRLLWYVQRALSWLDSAARGELVLPNEPFELPDFSVESETQVGFAEDAESFRHWATVPEQFGLVEFVRLSDNPEILAARRFRSVDGWERRLVSWGAAVTELEDRSRKPVLGAWILLGQVPVTPPWGAPVTWGDLAVATGQQGLRLFEELQSLARFFRDGLPHVVLLGFPIPRLVGEAPLQIHWQGLQLPVLSSGTKTARGFRANEGGYWQRDRHELLRDTSEITWLQSENWDLAEVSTRGQLPESTKGTPTVLLGVGAVGSAVSEMLVRGGVRGLTVIDGDRVHMGNLVRHSLRLSDVGSLKATALAAHLNGCHPWADVHGFPGHFPVLSKEAYEHIQRAGAIIDCTASDDLLEELSRRDRAHSALYVSVSLGLNARRLFVFQSSGTRFPYEAFRALVDPWVRSEQEDLLKLDLPREGVGCWDPVFPARSDDIWLMSSAAVKVIEAAMTDPPSRPTLAVFEQRWEGSIFQGVELVETDTWGA